MGLDMGHHGHLRHLLDPLSELVVPFCQYDFVKDGNLPNSGRSNRQNVSAFLVRAASCQEYARMKAANVANPGTYSANDLHDLALLRGMTGLKLDEGFGYCWEMKGRFDKRQHIQELRYSDDSSSLICLYVGCFTQDALKHRGQLAGTTGGGQRVSADGYFVCCPTPTLHYTSTHLRSTFTHTHTLTPGHVT